MKRVYTKEFKEQAVELAKEMGSFTAAAKHLGISDSAIHAWKSRASGGHENRSGLTEAQIENQKLRKENIELKKVNHILKAAAAFFSQDHLK